MKKSFILAVFMIGFGFATSPANAVVINFDSLTHYDTIDGVNLGGVTISSSPGFTKVVANGYAGVGYISPFNAITNYDQSGFLDGITETPMTFTFDSLVYFVSLTGGDGGGDRDQFSVDFYDDLHNLIHTFTTPVFGGNPTNPSQMLDNYTVTFSAPNIKSVVVRDAINFGIGIDNLEFDPVPEPSTMLLLGAGLAALCSFRYRLKK